MSQSQCSEDEEDYDDYDSYYQDDCYDTDADHSAKGEDNSGVANDPEYFDFKALNIEDVDRLLNESVADLQSSLQITPSLAKILLHRHGWLTDEIRYRYQTDYRKFLVESQLRAAEAPLSQDPRLCNVCYCATSAMLKAGCGHMFCKGCWTEYINTQIQEGRCTDIECMAEGCNVFLVEDMVLDLINKSQTREKYQRFTFIEYVKHHPSLRFCPGPGCSLVIYAKQKKARKVTCEQCQLNFCFGCGADYHAPTDCATIRKWLTKCIDDSETANYISAHTKDCPKCHVCIEKNGGCNHIQCSKCKYDFCWVCEGEWKTHAGEYYACSKFKEKENAAADVKHAHGDRNLAREALVKYLHYFTRWDNHAQSLKLEAQETEDMKAKIESKVLAKEGTWIDWQYLLDATQLLKRCRYTLQYTYPYAYYLEDATRKPLFEYQQGKLEAEVENLSWKVQKAEITHRGDLENQMDVAEKMRQTLLKDFLHS